jgi:hypothetical protein
MSTVVSADIESLFLLALLILTTGTAVLLCLTSSRLAPEADVAPTDANFLSGRRY